MNFKFIMGTSFTKFGLFVHKISLIINVTFPPLFLTLYAGRTKVLAEVLVMQAAFQLVVSWKMASLECISQGAEKKVGVYEIATGENKLRVQTAVCQVMASVLWDSEGILLVELLKRGATIGSEQYVQTSRKLK